LANRGKYIAAILTIVRAWQAAGRPGKLAQLPSYGAWSDYVRSPLVWLGKADPVVTIGELRSADPVRQQRAAVFRALAALPMAGYRTGELAKMAESWSYSNSGIGGEHTYPDLWEALSAIALNRRGDQKIDLAVLGRWLAKNTNNIVNGLRLECDLSDVARPRYSMIPVVRAS
jgi:putative DNA primase/helicase